MKHNRNPLFEAVNYALGAGVVAGLAMTAAPVFAQDDDEEAAELGKIDVTGSRISRADIEGALPVTVIDREDIELSGKTNVADLLRETSFNSAGSFRPQSGSSGQSFAGLSLRAIGSGRTLILIDGKRAPVAPNIGSAQDLNAVPLAAVERIEILTDGASAIYGSDAIGGVVNIITRKDFTGAELMYGTSFPEREGGDTEEGAAVIGISGDRGNIMAGVSFNSRDIIFARDREWSDSGASVFSNNFLDTGFAFLQHPEYGSANTAGCTGEGFSTTDPGPGRRCFYNFALVSADEASVKNESLFARARLEINRDWSLYMNGQVGRVTSFGRYAPVPSSPWLVGGFGAIVLRPGTPNHPGTPPGEGGLNPNWADYQDPIIVDTDDGPVTQYGGPDDTLLLTHRFAANGPRDTSTDANVYDIDIGFQGRVGPLDVDFGARRTESQYFEIGRNYIVSALAQPVFDAGDYNIYDPFGNSQETLQSFTATINRDANYLEEQFYASASMDLFDMAAGPVGFAFGAEYRDIEYRDIYDDLQANGNITGSAGNSASGGRSAKAAFVEALFPLLDTLELTAALRYDDYSDFGSEVSPKLALRFQPMDELTLRASWGQGFRAPPLDILSARPAFSAEDVVDADTCVNAGLTPECNVPGTDSPGSFQVTAFSIANPNLGAEQSDQFSVGAAYEPFDWLNGSIDYYNIEIEDRVASIGAQQVVNCVAGTQENCPPGLVMLDPSIDPPVPNAGLGVARLPGSNAIDYIQIGFASLGTIQTDGVDVNLRTNFDFGSAGRLSNEFQASYILSYEVDSGADVAGDAQLPKWRGTLANQYSFGDFTFAWNINYIDSQDTALSPNLNRLPSWTTHDVQVNWYAPWGGQVTAGVNNVGDKDPVLDPGELRGFNFNLYDAYGRVPYVRYTQTF